MIRYYHYVWPDGDRQAECETPTKCDRPTHFIVLGGKDAEEFLAKQGTPSAD